MTIRPFIAPVQRINTVSTFLIRRAGVRANAGGRTGAVTLIQLFGSAVSHNPHLHMLFVDGAYTFGDEMPNVHRVAAPTQAELQRLPHAIATRVTRALEKRGLLLRDDESPSPSRESVDEFEPLLAASIHYRIAIGRHTGRKALTLHTISSNPPTGNHCIVQLSGFSLHAGTRCQAHKRDSLERLCRKPAPDWEVVLDFNALGRAEGTWLRGSHPYLRKLGRGTPAASTLPRLPVPVTPGVEVVGVRPHAAPRFTRLPLDAYVALTHR